MSKPTYWELLKHPQWQKRRLEVLEAADFACTVCADKETTLHVHHAYYTKGAKPWEYPDDALKVLCETCHTGAERDKAALQDAVNQVCALGSYPMMRLLGYAMCLIAEATGEGVDPPLVGGEDGVADFCRADVWDVTPNAFEDCPPVDVVALRRRYNQARREAHAGILGAPEMNPFLMPSTD